MSVNYCSWRGGDDVSLRRPSCGRAPLHALARRWRSNVELVGQGIEPTTPKAASLCPLLIPQHGSLPKDRGAANVGLTWPPSWSVENDGPAWMDPTSKVHPPVISLAGTKADLYPGSPEYFRGLPTPPSPHTTCVGRFWNAWTFRPMTIQRCDISDGILQRIPNQFHPAQFGLGIKRDAQARALAPTSLPKNKN